MRDLDNARKIADAVLYEGYLLCPYRASAVKNQVRWQFGVLVPSGFTVTEEPSASQTECLLEGGELLHLRSRFLHVRHRTSEGAPPFDEASEREIDVVAAITDLLEGERIIDTVVAGGRETDGPVTRTSHPLDVRLRASAERLPGPYGLLRLRLRLENTTEWTGDERPEALRRSLVARAHVARRHRRDVRVDARPARVGAAGRGRLREPAHLAGAHRGRRDAVLTDHPL
ncbi:hypothetical protein [Actinomadura sp. HBU206391]|uniref:hypothetical protein n=1 Tax=Actinomadura sp. HBU206391 TaxID=2731692 RepID=UPI0021C787B2|nr:hypothetical protein [Actinomadura sp. HBU206391]